MWHASYGKAIGHPPDRFVNLTWLTLILSFEHQPFAVFAFSFDGPILIPIEGTLLLFESLVLNSLHQLQEPVRVILLALFPIQFGHETHGPSLGEKWPNPSSLENCRATSL